MRMNDVPVFSDDFTVIDLQDRFLAIPKNGLQYKLKPILIGGSGYVMLKQIDGKMTVQMIIEQLLSFYDVESERLVTDTLSTLSELKSSGLIITT